MQEVKCYTEYYHDRIRKEIENMIERGYKVVSVAMTENTISRYYKAIVVYEK